MPFRDGTGPLGQGPLTGRGLGPCGTGNYPRRFARFGRGFRARTFARPIYTEPRTKDEEKRWLEQDIEDIEQEMKDLEQEKREIQKRLKEI